MIKSFKHKGLQSFFETGSTKGIQAIHKRKLSNILFLLDKMMSLDDIPLNWNLHPTTRRLKRSMGCNCSSKLAYNL